MGVVIRYLEEEDRQALISGGEMLAGLGTSETAGKKVFFALFDGTNNDDNAPPSATTEQTTSIASLRAQMANATGDGSIITDYSSGLGTSAALWGSSTLPSQVTMGAEAIAENAYQRFTRNVVEWRAQDPTSEIAVITAAFSRGSLVAIRFAQMIYERGVIAPEGQVLVAPGTQRILAMVHLDPVATGFSGNIAEPPNVEDIVVLRAKDERRSLFPAAATGRDDAQIIELAGNHSDIGGGYRDNGIGALVLESLTKFLRNLGIPIADPPPDRQFNPDILLPVHSEGTDSYGNIQWDETDSGRPRLVDRRGVPARFETDEAGNLIRTYISADGQITRQVIGPDGQTLDWQISRNGSTTLLQSLALGGATLLDAVSLMKAIQTGQLLPIAATGLRLANDLSNLGGTSSLQLSGAASLASGLLSLQRLSQALDEGDVAGSLYAAANAINFSANAYASLVQQQTVVEAFGASSSITALSENLPYLNIAYGIMEGDATATALGALSLIPGGQFVALAYSVFTMVSGLLSGSPPDPWGNGRFNWSGMSLGHEAVGESGGQQQVSQVLAAVQQTMNALLEQVRRQNPGSTVGIIPGRMPSVSYDSHTGYSFTDIDPLTAEQRHPGLRFSVDGRPYNAEAGSTESYRSLVESLLFSALGRRAIAPMWEVRTAWLQEQAGAPYAGSTEEERAAREGLLPAPANGSTQVFRPVVLDLDGDGIQVRSRDDGVAFDVDHSGFLKQTAWIGAGDAFLVIDRDYNGQIDNGVEMFSNAAVGLSRRGLAGMAWVDANADGSLSPEDPVWSELRLWQDQNQDGVQQAAELRSLAAAGVTRLNYSMSRWEANGLVRQMASPDLEADQDGTRISVVPQGILIEQSADGRLSLLVTRVDDKTAVEANRDGLQGIEDIELIVDSRALLSNDLLGGFTGRDLRVARLGETRHGSGFVDVNGFVHFRPDADHAGDGAGFSYVVESANGQTGAANVDVFLEPVNDAPRMDAPSLDFRPIYGFTRARYYYDEYGAANLLEASYPIYQPYGITSTQPDWPDESSWWSSSTGSWMNDVYVYDTSHLSPGTEYRLAPVANEFTGRVQVAGEDIDDDAGSLSYALVSQPQYGSVSLGADGIFQYTSWKEPGVPSDRITVDGNWAASKDGGIYHPGNLPSPGIYASEDAFQVSITDPHGASTVETVRVPHFGPYLPPPGPGVPGKKPIAVDLAGDGFAFTEVDDSTVFFDVNGDGWRHRMAWVSAGDALLVRDVDGDGKITQAAEISFAAYKDGAQTDLEGLSALDSNRDGLLSTQDDTWRQFGLWQDANQDGAVDPGELHRLADLGVQSVGLASDGQFQVIDGQTVHGLGRVRFEDGRELKLADVSLEVGAEAKDPAGRIFIRPVTGWLGKPAPVEGSGEADLLLGHAGNDDLRAGDGNDVVQDDAGDDAVDAGAGDDVVFSGEGSDLVMLGVGNDLVFAGAGDDLLLGGDGDDALIAEAGNDVVFAGRGNDLLAGGEGNDLLSGDEGDDQLFGETGNDILLGGAGGDLLAGMDGNDWLLGGAGDDTLDGGAGHDRLEGGEGDDSYVLDQPGDEAVELAGEGIDSVRASFDFRLAEHFENLRLAGSAVRATGNASDNHLTGNGLANLLAGLAGDDLLDGGAGADVLAGGEGDDVYIVDDANDQVVEAAREGRDTVQARVSFSLPEHVERLQLLGKENLAAIGNGNANELTGNPGNNWLDGRAGADRMTGGAGDDTYVVDDAGDETLEQAGEGTDRIIASRDWTLAPEIEDLDLVGSALRGTGNALDNRITGNDGNNTLNGGAGADLMAGAAGDDLYLVDNAGDMVREQDGEGNDSVTSSIDYTLPAHVESGRLAGSEARQLSGNDDANRLWGNAGDNRLDGAGGADIMLGGEGNDSYLVDNEADQVIEEQGQGRDRIISTVSTHLPDHVEELQLAGDADLQATGNADDNLLLGNRGNNQLDGGRGADRMEGGAGDDSYVVDDAGDVVVEGAGEGADRIASWISLRLPEQVESLQLLGDARDGIGNALDNVLDGNACDNQLDGREGADSMRGGAGNDVYLVDNAADTVTEYAGEGHDSVFSSISYVMPGEVEDLTLLGTANIDGKGNALANLLTGNSGDNMLDGGKGADTLRGGAGKDIYRVDNPGDLVEEQPGEGRDTVISSISYTLADTLEDLVLEGDAVGATGNDRANLIHGNASDNVVDGRAGDDALYGRDGNDLLLAGQGNDYLDGGAGDDRYQYLQGDGLDYVVDAQGTDTVKLGPGLTRDTLALRVEEHAGQWLAFLRVLDAAGNELQDQGMVFAVERGVTGRFVSPLEYFELADGSKLGFDDLLVKSLSWTNLARGAVHAGRDDDVLVLGPQNLEAHGGNGNDRLRGSVRADQLFGDGGNDWLDGDNGDDTLNGGAGNDMLSGGNGRDTLVDLQGHNLLLGGMQDDTLRAGAGNDFLAGGKHDDLIVGGGGSNIIAFNAGDGRDTLLATAGARNTLSLGGGISVSGIVLAKSGPDLQLQMGGSDSITLKDWYLGEGQRDVMQLQWLGQDGHARRFDFTRLSQKFDAMYPQSSSSISLRDSAFAFAELAIPDGEAGIAGGALAAGYSGSGTFVPGTTDISDWMRSAGLAAPSTPPGSINPYLQAFDR